MTDTTPRVEQRHIDLANDYLNSAFRCTATLAERFAQFEADHLAQHRQPGQSGGEVDFNLPAHMDEAFVAAWCKMEDAGYQYSEGNVEKVHLGWLMAQQFTPSTERERRLEQALRQYATGYTD